MIPIYVNVTSAASLLAAAGTGTTASYGAGALVRLERATSQAGTYAEILTLALVSGTDQYTFWDASGTTTSWYKSRVSNSGGTSFSDYDTPIQATALRAYGTVDDLTELMPTRPTARNLNMLADLLIRASAHITAKCGRAFYRNPQVSGTDTFYFDGSMGRRLYIPEGLVSITTLSIAPGTNQTYIDQASTDYFLIPYPAETDDTYYGIELADYPIGTSPFFYFPFGLRNVKVVGVKGYPAVPEIIRAGTLGLARQMWSTIPTGQGDVGSDGIGPPIPTLLPRSTYEAIEWGRNRVGYAYV